MKELTVKELEKIYRENTNEKACKILGMSKVTLIKYIDAAGIERKGKGNPVGENAVRIKIIGE